LAGTGSEKTTAITIAEAKATTYAQNFALANRAGGVHPVLPAGDVTFGYFDGTTFTSPTPSGKFPNTAQVTLRYDGQPTTNPKLPLFFGSFIGTPSVPLTATARATIYTAPINSFTGTPRVLPMTYDQAHWNNFLATGRDSDGNALVDANGLPELQVYPSIRASGNFGELSMDGSHAGASTIRGWIDNGLSSSDVDSLIALNLIPLSQHPANTWDWIGNPGMKASTVMDVNNFTNQDVVLALYQAFNSSSSNYQAGTGNGSHYYYDIVQFVTVKIMPVSDSNKQVIVQPVGTVDPSFVFSPSVKPVPAGVPASDGSSPVTFTAPKLTQ
jgi:hypothetical protein